MADEIAAFRANPTGYKAKALSGTATEIESNFDALVQMGAKLTSLNLTVKQGDPPPQLQLNAAQFSAGAKTLAKIKGSYTLKVTNVTADQLNTVLANKKVTHVEVADTSANISAQFSSLMSNASKIDKVTQTGTASAISLTGAQFNSNSTATVLGKIWGKNAQDVLTQGEYSLTLRDVSMLNVAAATGNGKVSNVAVKDTSANISANLSALTSDKISSITQTDALGSIRITDTQYQNADMQTMLGKLTGVSSLAVSGVTAGRAAAVAADANVRSVAIKDSAANILDKQAANASVSKIVSTTIEDTATNITDKYSDIAAYSGLTKIKLTDSNNITLTASQLDAGKDLLAKIYDSSDAKGKYKLTVTGVAAANVASTARLSTVDKINVTDTVSNAVASLGALKSSSKVTAMALSYANADTAAFKSSSIDKLDELGAKLTSVDNGGASIGITYDQYVKRSATLAKLTGASFNVSGVGASVAQVLSDDTKVSGFSVRDSGANIAASVGVLGGVLSKLGTVTQSDKSDITLTKDQYNTAKLAGGVLSKVRDANNANNYSLIITGGLAADVKTLTDAALTDADTKIKQISVSDSNENITSNLYDLGAAASKIGTIVQSSASKQIGLSVTQLSNTGIAAVLGKISGGYTLDVSGVTTTTLRSIAENTKVAKFSLADSASNIADNLGYLVFCNSLKAMTVTDPDNAINVSASKLLPASADYAGYNSVFSKIDSDYTLNAQGATVAQAMVLKDNAKVGTLTIEDYGTSISARVDALNQLVTDGKLTSIKLKDMSNPLVLTSGQYADKTASMLGVIWEDATNKYKLSISGVSASDAADDESKQVNLDTHVVSYSVQDSLGNVKDKLAALDDRGGKLLSINMTGNDATHLLEISGTDYVDFIGTLSKINGGQYMANISDLNANDTAAAQADANIKKFSVKSTAAELASNLAALQAAAAATGGNAKIQTIANSGSDDVAMTFTQWQNSTDALGKMADSGVTWTVSDVAAGDVAAVFSDDQVKTITVSDTASNLVLKLGDSNNSSDLDTNAANITAITVKNDPVNGDVLQLSGSQYADNIASGGILDTLAKNVGGYHATITGLDAATVATATTDGNVDSFTVDAKGADLGAKFDDLVNAYRAGKLTGVTNSDLDPVPITFAGLLANPSDYAETIALFAPKPTITLS